MCEEDRTVRVKAAERTGGSAVGCLLFENIPGGSRVGFVWLPAEIEPEQGVIKCAACFLVMDFAR